MAGLKHLLEKVWLGSEKAKSEISLRPENNELNRILYQMLFNNNVSYYDVDIDSFINKGYAFNPHAYTVINFLARNISQVPLIAYIVKDKKMHREYLRQKGLGNHEVARAFQYKSLEKVDSGGLYELLNKPNENQGITEFVFEKIGFRKLTGNSYVYGFAPEGFSDDLFAGLYNTPSQIMQIVSGGWMEPVKEYKVQWSWGQWNSIEKNKICHQKEWNPKTTNQGQSLYGMSPLEPLLRSLKRSNESLDGSLALLKNGAPAGVMSNDADRPMNTEERKAAQDQLNKEFGGGENLNKILQSGSKVSWQQIGLSSVDLELLASDKIDLATFSRVYGIDVVIFDQEVSSYNNKLIAKKSVWEDTLIPELKIERDGFWNKFVAPGWSKKDGVEYFIDFDISEIPCLQKDRDMLIKQCDVGIKAGIWNRNESRIMLGDDPILNNPAMDEYETDLGKSGNVNINPK